MLHEVIKSSITRGQLKDFYLKNTEPQVKHSATEEMASIDAHKIFLQIMMRIVDGKYQLAA